MHCQSQYHHSSGLVKWLDHGVSQSTNMLSSVEIKRAWLPAASYHSNIKSVTLVRCQLVTIILMLDCWHDTRKILRAPCVMPFLSGSQTKWKKRSHLTRLLVCIYTSFSNKLNLRLWCCRMKETLPDSTCCNFFLFRLIRQYTVRAMSIPTVSAPETDKMRSLLDINFVSSITTGSVLVCTAEKSTAPKSTDQ